MSAFSPNGFILTQTLPDTQLRLLREAPSFIKSVVFLLDVPHLRLLCFSFINKHSDKCHAFCINSQSTLNFF